VHAPQIEIELRWDRFADKIPDDRAQFGLDTEAQTLIYCHNTAGTQAETVSPLAICVVGYHIEKRKCSEGGPVRRVIAENEEVGILIGVHKELD
jgi:hypothetical protein